MSKNNYTHAEILNRLHQTSKGILAEDISINSDIPRPTVSQCDDDMLTSKLKNIFIFREMHNNYCEQARYLAKVGMDL